MRNLVEERLELNDEDRLLNGMVVLRGTLEEQQLPSLRCALAEALEKVLSPVTGEEQRRCQVTVSPGTRPSDTGARSVEFSFQVALGDPHDLPVALAVLKLEACLGGAKQLLPQLTRILGEGAGCLSLRLDVVPAKDHVALPDNSPL